MLFFKIGNIEKQTIRVCRVNYSSVNFIAATASLGTASQVQKVTCFGLIVIKNWSFSIVVRRIFSSFFEFFYQKIFFPAFFVCLISSREPACWGTAKPARIYAILRKMKWRMSIRWNIYITFIYLLWALLGK